MATTVQAAMVRALALLSLDMPKIELLEIGALSGISAGTLYRAGLRGQREVYLTLIDPLTGYYGDGMVDGQTGVAVNKETIVANLAALGVGTDKYRIVEKKMGFSAAPYSPLQPEEPLYARTLLQRRTTRTVCRRPSLD